MTISTLAQGFTASVVVTSGQYVEVNNSATSRARIEHSTQGVVQSNHAGRRRYGPFNAGTVTVAAIVGDLTYDSGGTTDTTPLTPLEALVTDEGRGSSYYRAFLPGLQPLGSGAVIDYSGRGADGAITPTTALTDAECWAARDGFTTVVASSTPPKCVAIPAARAQIDGVTQSIIFSMRLRKANPASTETIAGFSAAGTGSTLRGWRLPLDSSGSILMRITDGTNQFNHAGSLLKATEASAVWHTVAFAFDCVTKQFFLWIDGVLSDGPVATGITGTLIPTASNDLWIGGNSNVANASIAGVFSGVHLIGYPGALPGNITSIIRQMHTNPFVPLNAVQLGA